MFWSGAPHLRHSAHTHWCSLPSAHKCRQGPARPCAKTRPLHKDTHQLLGEALWVSLWLPRVRLQRCRVCACAALVMCTVCMHWGRPPAELRVDVRWAKLAWRFGCVGLGAVRRKRPVGAPLLAAAGQRLRAGGRGGGEKEA